MLTPAEELGLAGMNVASRVRGAFHRIDEITLAAMLEQIRERCVKDHVVYLRDGRADAINVMACPLTVLPDQVAYIHWVTLTIHNALKRLVELYMQDFAVRDILRLPPEEEQWLWECWTPAHRENNPVFGRHDAVIDFTSPMWKDSLRFVEPNMGGIGGLHMVPAVEQIISSIVFPILKRQDEDLQLSVGSDIRELLMQEILEHLESVGRKARNICFIDPKYASSGIDEQEDVARYYHEKYGLRVMHADPAELTQEGAEVLYNGQVVDLAYRDYAVCDLLELEKQGANIGPMRTLFRQNRVMSSITADLDQKSCWEVFTDPQFTHKYFSADERQVFRRHILWTRLLQERRTLLPDGQTGNLLPYVREEQETLVLKPNRGFGGQGVLLGPAVSAAEWEAAVNISLADPNRWVVQQLASLPVNEFPVVGPAGKLHLEPFYTVMGFAPSKYGVAILGRASQKHVVNVAQRGGMCAVVRSRAPTRLVGPTS
jgi:hypothetical protein